MEASAKQGNISGLHKDCIAAAPVLEICVALGPKTTKHLTFLKYITQLQSLLT